MRRRLGFLKVAPAATVLNALDFCKLNIQQGVRGRIFIITLIFISDVEICADDHQRRSYVSDTAGVQCMGGRERRPSTATEDCFVDAPIVVAGSSSSSIGD